MYNYLIIASSESDSDNWEVPSHESYSDEEEELDSDIKEELLCELHKLLNYIPIRRHIHPIRRTLIDIRIRKICLFLIKIKEQESQPIFSSETAELLNETYDSETDDSYHPDDDGEYDEDEDEQEDEEDEREEDEIPMLEPNESDESNKQNDIKMENKSVIDDKGKKIITFKDVDENDSEKDTSDDDDDESSESESSESEKSEDESNEEPEEQEQEESNQKSQSNSKKLKQPKENIESDESIEAITFDDKELDEKELLDTQKEIKKILSQSHNSIYGNSNGINLYIIVDKWDNVDEETKEKHDNYIKETKKSQRKWEKSRKLDKWNEALDKGKIPKVKKNKNKFDQNNKRSNPFQNFQEKKMNKKQKK